ncbi:DUF6894 family protein [Bradyrhizobium sp. RDM4]|uniref:DUF6894 family protein n=1 Tax=Bradyrhizobium sp. RDM4 TaxID=3378765 RepID=UPI0038FCA5DF
MPRYHFHILDGTAVTDETGVELPGIAEARIEAIQLAGGVLREGMAGHFWHGEPWQLLVSDSPSPTAARAYFVLNFSMVPSSQSRESAITAGYQALAHVLDVPEKDKVRRPLSLRMMSGPSLARLRA